MTQNDKLELVGPYEVISNYFSKVDSIADITRLRSEQKEYRVKGYWTGNFAVYGSEAKNGTWQPFILIGDDDTLNPIQKNALAAAMQFQSHEEYTPLPEELEAIIEAEKTGRVARMYYNDLDQFGGLRKRMLMIDDKKDEENCYLLIEAERLIHFSEDKDYFSPTQRKLLTAVYGDPELAGRIMKEEDVKVAPISFVSEYYLEKLGRGKIIARTSWTNRKSHNFGVSFSAKCSDEIRMRGQARH